MFIFERHQNLILSFIQGRKIGLLQDLATYEFKDMGISLKVKQF
jgi:hypothetical protein